METLPDFLVIPTILIRDRSLQPLDREVYGLVYWFKKLKNEKCTASNETFANILGADKKSVSNSLQRLNKREYVKVVLDPVTNYRLEIIPLISFAKVKAESASVPATPPLNDGGSPTSVHVQNNKSNEKKTSSFTNVKGDSSPSFKNLASLLRDKKTTGTTRLS